MSPEDIARFIANESAKIARDLGASSIEEADRMLAATRGPEPKKRKAPVKSSAKPSKRQIALDLIFYDVARNGHIGTRGLRAMSEGRIGHAAMLEAGRRGMRHRENCTNPACQCKMPE